LKEFKVSETKWATTNADLSWRTSIIVD